MSREDLYSIIVYIRQLEPKQSNLQPTHLEFPMNLIVRTIPKPVTIRETDSRPRGEYLATVGNCWTCHTADDGRGQKLPGMDFAGGREFTMPDGSIVRSVNLTPDAKTGIGSWSRDQFISVFKRYQNQDLRQIPVQKGNTVMPWTYFSEMKEEDLGAIFDYLSTLKPISNPVNSPKL
jgi:cytochrome c